jgi:hypothetical protein
MGNDTIGATNLRAENISKLVTGFALQSFKLKPLCMVDSSSSWVETYYRESATELTGGQSANVKGIPRLASFPYGEVQWTKVSQVLEKYGIEGVISWEDENTNNVPAVTRTLLRIGRAVAYAIDVQIETVIKANAGNTVTITTGSEWNSATVANRDPVQNILDAKREIAIDNYDPDSGNAYLCVNPSDYASMLGNTKIVNNPTFKSADVVSNGVVGEICGCKLVVTNAITVSNAYLVIAKEALTWKEAMPLRVITIEDPMIKTTIRAGSMGVCQIPNPNAICRIKNTRA